MKQGCFEASDFRTHKISHCFHSGDLGDIIYSLLFCKHHLGTIHLTLGPDPRVSVREEMTKQKFDWLAPLLIRQPWIEQVRYGGPPSEIDYNLNHFRRSWFNGANAMRKDKRLFEIYSEHFRKEPLPENEAWLEAHPAYDTAHPVVVNRTSRWQNPAFPWKLVADTYRNRMVFVGTPQEYRDWERQFGAIEYRQAVDALDLANIIAGCQLFVGNQSFPMSLALALNVPVIQESCPIQADCVFRRSNAQFTHQNTAIVLPKLKPEKMRIVSNSKNKDGLIELGPCNGAPGIGDTLMLTPLARALGDKAVMLLPSGMERMRFMFRNLCPVRVTEDFPVMMWQKDVLQSTGFLRLFRLNGVDPIPRIDLDPDMIKQARESLASFRNPIAFCPTCSRHWAHVRQRPPLFWRPIIAQLAKRYTVLQFGLPDYPELDGALRMKFVSLEHTAACYHLIGNYVGVNTGDHHLMMAIGGRAVVAEADPFNEWKCWTYDAPKRIQYGKLSNPKTVLDAMERLGL